MIDGNGVETLALRQRCMMEEGDWMRRGLCYAPTTLFPFMARTLPNGRIRRGSWWVAHNGFDVHEETDKTVNGRWMVETGERRSGEEERRNEEIRWK